MSNSNDPKEILAKYRAKVAASKAQSDQSIETAQHSQPNEAAQAEAEKNGHTNEAALSKQGAPKTSALKNASALEKQKQQAAQMFDQLSKRSDEVNEKYFQKLAEIGKAPDYDPNSKKTKKALDKVIAEFAPQFAELEKGFGRLDALLASIDNAQWIDG